MSYAALWGALAGALMGHAKGWNALGQTINEHKRSKRRLEQWDEKSSEEFQRQNAQYLRNMQDAQARVYTPQGAGGIAAQRNLLESGMRGMADIAIQQGERYATEKTRLEDEVERLGALRHKLNTWGGHYGDYVLPGAATGAAIGGSYGQGAGEQAGKTAGELKDPEALQRVKAQNEAAAAQAAAAQQAPSQEALSPTPTDPYAVQDARTQLGISPTNQAETPEFQSPAGGAEGINTQGIAGSTAPTSRELPQPAYLTQMYRQRSLRPY